MSFIFSTGKKNCHTIYTHQILNTHAAIFFSGFLGFRSYEKRLIVSFFLIMYSILMDFVSYFILGRRNLTPD